MPLATQIEGFEGRILAPDDEGFDAARQAFNLAVDQRPGLITQPTSDADVAAAVRYARQHGIQIAPQRTGHGAKALGDLGDAMLLKTDRLGGVEIDADARRARVRAGTLWADLVPAAAEHGLATLHGSSPFVGVVGYTVGGGVGWYARKHGLAANNVSAIELVTAEGELTRTDHENDSELFWALRGGCGNFGVVTTVELELFPIPEVYAGTFFFPWERAAEVLHTWRDLLPSFPEELTSGARILQIPQLEQIPAPLRGKQFALVEAVFIGAQDDGAELLRPLRDLGPVIDSFVVQPPTGIMGLHMDPPVPVPAITDSAMLGDLPTEAIDTLVELAGPGSGSMLVFVELRHCGGALDRGAPDHGALAKVDGEVLMGAVGSLMDPSVRDTLASQLDRLTSAMDPYSTTPLSNFTENERDPSDFFDDRTYRRLADVKQKYDADPLFRANHAIAPTP